MSCISTNNLTKYYGRRVGVDHLSIDVSAGELLGFLGPNGAGKTTTIRLLMGLLKPNSGSACVFDLDCWQQSHKVKAGVGYLPGDLRLYPWFTARYALKLFSQIHRKDMTREGEKLTELFDLDPDLRVDHMSRGTRQKLGLILALAPRPPLLILDEPTTGLDPIIQYKLYTLLRSLADEGHTIFFSSHTLSEVETLCDRVMILRKGKVVANESIESLRDRAKRVVTIYWKNSANHEAIMAPTFLTVSEKNSKTWTGTIEADAMELMRWCQDKPIADVIIEQPDLSALFQQYYLSPENSQ